MAVPQIFHYGEDFVYTGSDLARISPREPGKVLVPRHATLIEPPSVPEGSVAVFDPTTEAWVVEKSLMNTTVWEIATKRPLRCELHRLPLSGLYTDQEPLPGSNWDAETKTWVVTEEALRAATEACRQLTVLQLRERRNLLRDGGYTVAPGVTLNTNTTGRTSLKEIVDYLGTNETGTIDFQTKEGWVDLDSVTANRYHLVITEFVQACFTACRKHEERVAGLSTIDQLRAYDQTTDWPSNSV